MVVILTHRGDIFPVPLKGDIIPVRSQSTRLQVDGEISFAIMLDAHFGVPQAPNREESANLSRYPDTVIGWVVQKPLETGRRTIRKP